MATLRNPIIVVVAAAVALVGALWLMFGGSEQLAGRPTADPEAPPPLTALEAVVSTCSAGELRDGGDTLVLDMYVEGVDTPLVNAITVDDITCVLGELEAPASMTERMDRTRALDGVQEAAWAGMEASWSYHPDNGLDIILTLAK